MQLLATPVIPNVAREELEHCERHFTERGSCPFCDLIAHERASRARVVTTSEAFLAVAPYASRFAYESWILPLRHEGSFTACERPELDALAAILQDLLGRVRRTLHRPAYNFLIHSAPARTLLPWYHWHMELVPKLSAASGFEWGTGAYINAVAPEEAAERMRAAGSAAAAPGSE